MYLNTLQLLPVGEFLNLCFKELSLKGHGIGSESIEDIAALLSSCGMRRLYMDNNNIETTGAIKVARKFELTRNLQDFTISSNNIGH